MWDDRGGFLYISDEEQNKIYRIFLDGRKEELVSMKMAAGSDFWNTTRPSGSPNSLFKDASACRAMAVSFSTAPGCSSSGAVSYQVNGARLMPPHFSRTTALSRNRTSSAPSAAISSTPDCRLTT